ncbi:hypothetical protein FCULG_00009639 [Fusarium culmorum]|uniref:Uncharacterized protein n=1 Tax=Fusarium culmorum TaxID=5516 RepID=A0A2T4GHF5_FUSCU|nr:hypothetical protein FCULG_00009639 [Fusarium culmorum]
MDMKESPSKGPDVLYEEGTREAQVRAGQQRARLLRTAGVRSIHRENDVSEVRTRNNYSTVGNAIRYESQRLRNRTALYCKVILTRIFAEG